MLPTTCRRRFFSGSTALLAACMALTGWAGGMQSASGSELSDGKAEVTGAPRGHAHNDYLHPRPLADALALGFVSVEADVFVVDGDLLVAHTRREIRPGETLRKLYLEPLRKRVQDNAGRVDPARSESLILLVDIKSDAEATYRVLHEQLAEYAEILSRMENGRWQPGPVTVVVSGNRPQETIAKQSLRYVGIDGRLSDLGDGRPAELVPLISDRWGSHFSWNGTGPMPDDQRRRLSDIVAQTKAAGQQLRFWATPESVALWTELADAGVDLIGTDELERLAQFLESRRE